MPIKLISYEIYSRLLLCCIKHSLTMAIYLQFEVPNYYRYQFISIHLTLRKQVKFWIVCHEKNMSRRISKLPQRVPETYFCCKAYIFCSRYLRMSLVFIRFRVVEFKVVNSSSFYLWKLTLFRSKTEKP